VYGIDNRVYFYHGGYAMRNEIIAKKRCLIIAAIALVILLVISLGIYISIKSRKIDEEYGVYYMPYMTDIDSIGSDICFDVAVRAAEHGEINHIVTFSIYFREKSMNILIFCKKCKKLLTRWNIKRI
jgi:hypothetical protein